MTSQELVGRAMRANRPLDLPTKHKVAEGETFRYLQAHLDGGAIAEMWVRAGTVTLLDDDVTIRLPADPVGPKGRRRNRAAGAEPTTDAAVLAAAFTGSPDDDGETSEPDTEAVP